MSVGVVGGAGAARGETPAVVRIAGSGWVGDAVTKVAAGLDLFNAERSPESPTRIRVDDYPSGNQALQAMLRGDAELALVATPPLARTLLQFQADPTDPARDVVVLASLALSNYTHHLVGRRDRGIAAPDDLAGKRIGMEFGTSAHYRWTLFARYHRLADAAVVLVDIPLQHQVDAFLSGRVDGVMTWEPTISHLLSRLGEGEGVIFDMRSIDTMDWMLVGSRAWVRAQRVVVQRVLRAYARAEEIIDEDPARARALHAKVVGIPAGEIVPLEDGVIWRMSLDGSILTNLEALFDWWRAFDPALAEASVPAPASYLECGPLRRTQSDCVDLPSYLCSAEPDGEPGK